MFEERPPMVIVEPAYLEDNEKTILNIDFIQWRKGKPRVRIISEFRDNSGEVKRVVAWLEETDSIRWSENPK